MLISLIMLKENILEGMLSLTIAERTERLRDLLTKQTIPQLFFWSFTTDCNKMLIIVSGLADCAGWCRHSFGIV